MSAHVFQRESTVRSDGQHPPEQRQGGGGQLLPQIIGRACVGAHILVELGTGVGWAVPRGVPGQQDEQDDATGPDVDDVGSIAGTLVLPPRAARDDLGGDIRRTAAEGGGQLGGALVLEQCGQAKIGNLQVPVGCQQHILGLDVAMADPFGVHVAHRTDQLREIRMGDILADAFVGLDLVEQVPSLGQLHGYPAPGIILAGAKEPDDVVMAPDVLVHGGFHLQLAGADLPMACGILFVDELDGDHGRFRAPWAGFFDTIIAAAVSVLDLIPTLETERVAHQA